MESMTAQASQTAGLLYAFMLQVQVAQSLQWHMKSYCALCHGARCAGMRCCAIVMLMTSPDSLLFLFKL